MSSRKNTEARSANFQEFPFGQVRPGDGPVSNGVFDKGFAHKSLVIVNRKAKGSQKSYVNL